MNETLYHALDSIPDSMLIECERVRTAGLPKKQEPLLLRIMEPIGVVAMVAAVLAVLIVAPDFLKRKPMGAASGTEGTDTTVSVTDENGFDFTGIPDDLKEAFLEAYAALNWLDEEVIEQLNQDYSKQMGDAAWLGGLSPNVKPGEASLLGGTHCYGVFEDCIVILVPTIMNAIGSGTVAGERFTYPTLFHLYGYHDGVFYSLREAYEKGYISQEEVALAAERHRAVWRYHLLLTRGEIGPVMTPSGPVYFTETTEKEETME